MPRIRSCLRLLVRWLKLAVLVYVGVLLVLMFFENAQVYPAATAAQDWQAPPIADIVDVNLTTPAGALVHGWWCPCPGSEGALLYLHGNAGNLSHRGPSLVKMRDLLKVGVLIVDYPGYGKSAGVPSESGCYAAADAGYDWLVHQQKIEPGQVLIFGASLGGGVATDLASRRDCRALVLVKTFTSMPDVGQRHFPWLPVRWLMRNRFDNQSKIQQVRRPVFFSHGPADEVIPFTLGQKLFEAAGEPKEFYTLAGGHNSGLPQEYFRALKVFLEKHAPAPAAAH